MMAPIDGYNRGASTRTVNYRRARMTDGPVTYFPFFQQPLKPRPFKAGCQQSPTSVKSCTAEWSENKSLIFNGIRVAECGRKWPDVHNPLAGNFLLRSKHFC